MGFPPAPLSAEDRALIDAAVAAGKVRRIPAAATTAPEIIWRGGQLVYADREEARRASGTASGAEHARAEGRRNRVTIVAMAAEGKSTAEISQAVGVGISCVCRHLKAARRGMAAEAPQGLREAGVAIPTYGEATGDTCASTAPLSASPGHAE